MTEDRTSSWWTPPWSSALDDHDASWSSAPADPNGDSPKWRINAGGLTFDDDSILAPLEAEFGQVRSRDRVRDLAEVFAQQREVDAMLDTVRDAIGSAGREVPGTILRLGELLVEILRRKLRLVTKVDCVSQEHYEHRLVRVLTSIYGVDVSAENVVEARGRMAHVLLGHYQTDANTVEPTAGFLNAAALILGDNIVCGDMLNAAEQIELCDWAGEQRPLPARVELRPRATRRAWPLLGRADPGRRAGPLRRPPDRHARHKGRQATRDEGRPLIAAADTGTGEGRQRHIPDILDVIAALSSDAIPTPPVLARALSTCTPRTCGRTRPTGGSTPLPSPGPSCVRSPGGSWSASPTGSPMPRPVPSTFCATCCLARLSPRCTGGDSANRWGGGGRESERQSCGRARRWRGQRQPDRPP